MSGIGDRHRALEEIRTIIERHGLRRADIEPLFRSGDRDQTEQAGQLSRILGILGGIFVFSGVSVFVALNWSAMNSAERIIVTLGPGITAFLLALIADREERYRGAVPTLTVVAALLQTTGLFVTLEELASDLDWHAAATCVTGVMALQSGILFWTRRDQTSLFLLIGFAFWLTATAFDWIHADRELTATILGAAAIGLSAGLDRTTYTGLTPFWYFAGSVAFLAGMYELLDSTPAEILFLGFASGGVFLSTTVRSRLMLGVSTVAMLGFIAEFTVENFADSLGWPIVLILIGISLIVLSGFAIRVNRKYMSI